MFIASRKNSFWDTCSGKGDEKQECGANARAEGVDVNYGEILARYQRPVFPDLCFLALILKKDNKTKQNVEQAARVNDIPFFN